MSDLEKDSQEIAPPKPKKIVQQKAKKSVKQILARTRKKVAKAEQTLRSAKMSAAKAQTTFWVFAALMGASLSSIFLMYTGASITRVFFITAGTFGAMSIYGYTTKRDLTKLGSFLMMGLFGIIIASLVNIFMKSTMMYFVISIIGVLIFVGLTAYDTQKIKNMYLVSDSGEIMGKKAVMGALTLYLDFINLFIMLLRLFGQRR